MIVDKVAAMERISDDTGIRILEQALTAAISASWNESRHLRVPKGNGRLSGRFLDMPDVMLDRLQAVLDDLPGRKARPLRKALDDAREHVRGAKAQPLGSVKAQDELRQASQVLLDAMADADPQTGLTLRRAALDLQDFASVDWEDDPEGYLPTPSLPEQAKEMTALQRVTEEYRKPYQAGFGGDDPRLPGYVAYNNYTGEGYGVINISLRNEDPAKWSDEVRKNVTGMDDQFTRAGLKTDHDMVVFRGGVPDDMARSLVVLDKGFLSTSVSENYANKFGEPIEIEIPSGTPYLPHGVEGEMTFPRGSVLQKISLPGEKPQRWRLIDSGVTTEPGPEHVSAATADSLAAKAMEGGFTWQAYDRKLVTSGGFVVAHEGKSQRFPATNKAEAAAKIREFLDSPDSDSAMVGGWYDKEHGEIVLDPVEIVKDRDEAIKLGERRNQQAIFDLDTMTEIDTGGTGDRDAATGVGPPSKKAPDVASEPVAGQPGEGFLSGFTKGAPMSIEQAGQTNPLGGDKNCQMCVTAYELRREGYDVQAREGVGGANFIEGSGKNWLDWWEIDPPTPMHVGIPLGGKSNSENFGETLAKMPNGSRGFFELRWNLGKGNRHIMSWEKDADGNITLVDTQRGLVRYTMDENDPANAAFWGRKPDILNAARVIGPKPDITKAVVPTQLMAQYRAAVKARNSVYDSNRDQLSDLYEQRKELLASNASAQLIKELDAKVGVLQKDATEASKKTSELFKQVTI